MSGQAKLCGGRTHKRGQVPAPHKKETFMGQKIKESIFQKLFLLPFL